jgi:prepilin-type N-terminal cleavage/methylation domain-containing protein
MTARKNSHHGFTLVELLVVITIIGMLVTLAITGVNYAKKAALRAKCTNYQSDLGKGINNFQSSKGYFPGFISLWRAKPVNWVVMILEWTDHKDVWDASWRDTGVPLATAQGIASLKIGAFACPADSTNQDPAPLNYVVNSRICPDLFISTDTSSTAQAARNLKKITSSHIQTASTTILLAERQKNTPTVTGPWVTVSGTSGTVNTAPLALTFTWNASGLMGTTLTSPHGAGALVTFCDGRVQFLPDTTDCSAYLPTTLPGI